MGTQAEGSLSRSSLVADRCTRPLDRRAVLVVLREGEEQTGHPTLVAHPVDGPAKLTDAQNLVPAASCEQDAPQNRQTAPRTGAPGVVAGLRHAGSVASNNRRNR